MDFSSYRQQVSEHVNLLLKQQIDAIANDSADLKAAMSYALLSGGKRMRPFLLYACGDMLGVVRSELDAVAVALEAIHAYSLVHDDLPAMDDDDLRRGQPTCHIAFDEATAILAGDALQSLAFAVLANASFNDKRKHLQVQLISQLAQAAGIQGMCGGQALDLAATGQQLNQTALETMHRKKTGALLTAAISMPILLAKDVDQHSQQQLAIFAERIGLAFQVQDDILDVESDSQTLGKPQGSDAAANKCTFVSLLGLEQAKAYLQQLHEQALHALQALPYNSQVLQAFTDYLVKRDH